MDGGTVKLMGAVCYVTKDGCKLLETSIENFKTQGSFFIAGYNEISDIESINTLCSLAPGKFNFHGIAARGSEDKEGHLLPGLMHDKLIYAEGASEATVWLGSHNFTHNGLWGVNIESATITTGNKDDAFFKGVRAHLEAILKESFPGPAALPHQPTIDKPIRELVLIHCEASEEQIKAIGEQKNCFISIHLRQDAYDSLCRPPASPEKHVRLHLYAAGELDQTGPLAPAKLVKAGELYGVNFTEKSVRRGNTADWPAMTFAVEEPAGETFQPLRLCSEPHDPNDDVTVCAIRVDDALEEPSEVEKCCILSERPTSEVKPSERRLDLSQLKGTRRKRYIMLIDSLRKVAVMSGRSPIAGEIKMRQLYSEKGEDISFEHEKKPFRFIHNGKLFALPELPI